MHHLLEGWLWAVAGINAQLGLQVLHNHVDNQWSIQLHIVEALVLEVWANCLAGLLGILQNLLLGVLQAQEQADGTLLQEAHDGKPAQPPLQPMHCCRNKNDRLGSLGHSRLFPIARELFSDNRGQKTGQSP